MPLTRQRDGDEWYWIRTGEPSAKMLAYREHRAAWLRFELDIYHRVVALDDDAKLAVVKLLLAGRRDGRTRPDIERIIRFTEVAEQRLFAAGEVTELQRIFRRVKNGES